VFLYLITYLFSTTSQDCNKGATSLNNYCGTDRRVLRSDHYKGRKSNSISPVKCDKIISYIINISKQPFIIDQLTTSNLKWEPYTDNVFITSEEVTRRIELKRLKKLLTRSI